MSKLNFGSNENEDNSTETAISGMLNMNIPEPKMLEKGKYQCTICNMTFGSKEAYISHAMARHQPSEETVSEPIM